MLEEIEIEEKKLEQILYENPGYLEEGMRAIARQYPTDSGPLDLLLADEDDVLVVVELKNEEDDYQLLQALRYYDYIAEHIYELTHHFKENGITVNEKDPAADACRSFIFGYFEEGCKVFRYRNRSETIYSREDAQWKYWTYNS